MMKQKPTPRAHVYDWTLCGAPDPAWRSPDLHEWLRDVAPTVACELAAWVKRCEVNNGYLVAVVLSDHDEGLCGNTLSADTRAWLREHVAPTFWLHVWW